MSLSTSMNSLVEEPMTNHGCTQKVESSPMCELPYIHFHIDHQCPV